ncbi:SapC family protein [Massilia sp. IC2-278]|uniref:SapC family protein n=1 Tax=Massilia sp. IC2-278 TaxID=2887200 RepID=UPI001E3E2F84|nr:SapC family protein [Massilia sp. IC2-278]MCC2959750.1 SapC family protein [Massilia sp. IC2-278]
MFKQVVPVNQQRHAGKKIKQVEGFGFASQFHIAYVTTHEFVRSAAIYPLVFIEDKEKDEFRPVALLGLDAGENLFVGENGKWSASYVPAIIRRYPFALSQASDDGRFLVCVDEGSELLSDTEGTPLFNEQGEPTEVIENVKRYLSELQQMDAITAEFCKFLAKNNLFVPLNMRVRQNDKIKNISGCYVINEERLNNLSDELFLEMRTKHYLPAIYAQLTSLSQIERLVMLKDEQAKPAA